MIVRGINAAPIDQACCGTAALSVFACLRTVQRLERHRGRGDCRVGPIDARKIRLPVPRRAWHRVFHRVRFIGSDARCRLGATLDAGRENLFNPLGPVRARRRRLVAAYTSGSAPMRGTRRWPQTAPVLRYRNRPAPPSPQTFSRSQHTFLCERRETPQKVRK